MNIFEKATRQKVLFESPKGLLTVQDLWDLPLVGSGGVANLDDIAIALHVKLREENQVSFVSTKKEASELLQLKFDIVKHIIEVKLEEKAAKALVAENRAKKERILEIIERKQSRELEETSLEDLQKMVKDL